MLLMPPHVIFNTVHLKLFSRCVAFLEVNTHLDICISMKTAEFERVRERDDLVDEKENF